MLDNILDIYKASSYDFRPYACPEDPLADYFEEWVDYYRMKWAISRALKPKTVLEVGVRYGYSARAFLEGSPEARFVGIDADTPNFGGQPGAVDWAEKSLAAKFDITMVKKNSQSLSRFPGEVYDLIHVDGQQDGDGTFRDLDLASLQARHILVDGYQWTRDNFLAVNEWLWLNKAAIEAAIIIPGYAGELLIRTKVAETCVVDATSSAPLAHTYTADYYLNDCGGYTQWRRSKGKKADPRLQAVADAGMALCTPDKVVDLGAGRGELSKIFAQQGARVTAIDYSADAVRLIEKTLAGDSNAKVDIVCGSVLNPDSYDENYDLAVASDIVEHLSPEENDALYEIVSQKLKPGNGVLVVHTAPNLWCYRYEHPRQQRAAKQAGFWLPRTRRTWYERLMHINEQNPRMLKRQLLRHFPHVLVWFTDDQGMGGSLLRDFSIADMRRATSLFAVASHRPIDRKKLESVFCMAPLSPEDAEKISLQIERIPEHIHADEVFSVTVILINSTSRRLASLMPNPFHLSYHWLDEAGEETVVYDGLRSAIEPPLPGGQRGTYAVQVKAPGKAGQYALQVLPVQEMVRWHDSASPNKLQVQINADFPLAGTVFDSLDGSTLGIDGGKILHNGYARPVMLIVETVNICNNDRLTCDYDRMTRPRQTMEMKVFAKVLEDYRAMGGGALSLTPVVGDVLLDKNIMERLKLIKEYAPQISPISVTTNLIAADRFTDEELAEFIGAFGRIHVSIYGLSKSEYLALARKDNYGKLLRALRRISDMALTANLHLGFRFLQHHSEEEILEWIVENVGAVVPYSKTSSFANWGVLDDTSSLPFDAQWITAEEKTEPCLIPLVAMQVFSNGKVSFCPCDDFDNDISLELGDITDSTLIELYNQSKVRSLWTFDPAPTFCVNCSFYRPVRDLLGMKWIFNNPIDFIGG